MCVREREIHHCISSRPPKRGVDACGVCCCRTLFSSHTLVNIRMCDLFLSLFLILVKVSENCSARASSNMFGTAPNNTLCMRVRVRVLNGSRPGTFLFRGKAKRPDMRVLSMNIPGGTFEHHLMKHGASGPGSST